MLSIQIFSVLGLVVSWYAYTVERNLKVNTNYHPFCDISDSMSCTKAFMSPSGHLLGISNALGGIMFYTLLFALTFLASSDLIFYLTLASFWGTIYLAYVSYVKMRNFCLVCNLIYIINVLLFIFGTRLLFAA